MTLHFATSFKYEQVYPIYFLSGFPKRLGQIAVTYWVYLDFFSVGGLYFWWHLQEWPKVSKNRRFCSFLLF